MTVVIKRSADKASLEKLLGKLKRVGKFQAHKYCGTIKLEESPMEIQKRMRDEW